MHHTNPVGIWQIHTDWRARRGISCFTCNIHDVVSNSDHFALLMLRHEWHVVFEPLGIIHQDFHALACIKVLDLNHGFVASRVP